MAASALCGVAGSDRTEGADRLRAALATPFDSTHKSIARRICSLSGMPSRSLMTRSAARCSSSMKIVADRDGFDPIGVIAVGQGGIT